MAMSTDKKVTKMDQARVIFKSNLRSIQAGTPGTRARILARMQDKCGLTPGAASTYYQTIRGEFIRKGELIVNRSL